MLEENTRANPDARIRPLTHASVNRARQAKSVGSNSLVSILIAIRRMSENQWGNRLFSRSQERSASTSRSGFLAKIWSVHGHTITI
jgi:hypothetical protein